MYRHVNGGPVRRGGRESSASAGILVAGGRRRRCLLGLQREEEVAAAALDPVRVAGGAGQVGLLGWARAGEALRRPSSLLILPLFAALTRTPWVRDGTPTWELPGLSAGRLPVVLGISAQWRPRRLDHHGLSPIKIFPDGSLPWSEAAE